ncbi:MAG: CAP domain-containing protein [Bacteroidetes bacterium]|nr:CAP domain-containing protein [Bacteroidota bacterium]
MIKGIVCCWLMLVLLLASGNNKWLSKNSYFLQNSYYKENVYAELDTKSFYQLNEIQKQIDIENLDLHLLNACLFFATNRLRLMYHLAPLKMDKKLLQAVVIHSEQMAQYQFFEHDNPYNSKLKTEEDRFAACGIKEYQTTAENCHLEYFDDVESSYIKLAQEIIESLYNSPPHRYNLLYKDFQFSACGTAIRKTAKGEIHLYVTQDFYTK